MRFINSFEYELKGESDGDFGSGFSIVDLSGLSDKQLDELMKSDFKPL